MPEQRSFSLFPLTQAIIDAFKALIPDKQEIKKTEHNQPKNLNTIPPTLPRRQHF